MLIEDFMVKANETVATHSKYLEIPVLYRVHDAPQKTRLAEFARVMLAFGVKLKGAETSPKVIQKVIDQFKDKEEFGVVNEMLLRSMSKAKYDFRPMEHYGLALENYCHFTSPIRRYPDMMVHRLLERYLAGGRSVVKAKYEDMCEHCSAMEQVAANAERASTKYKQVEFMSDKLGMVFDGVISGVTEWGLYVELNENKCEGLVPVRDLDDDYYEFDEKNYCLIGRRKKRVYRLGDPITIKVAQANLERKQLDFAMVD